MNRPYKLLAYELTALRGVSFQAMLDTTISMDLEKGITTYETPPIDRNEISKIWKRVGERLGVKWETCRFANGTVGLDITAEPTEESMKAIDHREKIANLMVGATALPIMFENDRMGILTVLNEDDALVDMYLRDESQQVRVPLKNMLVLGEGAIVAGLRGVEVKPFPSEIKAQELYNARIAAADARRPPPDPGDPDPFLVGDEVAWDTKEGGTMSGVVEHPGAKLLRTDYSVVVAADMGSGMTQTYHVPRSKLERIS